VIRLAVSLGILFCAPAMLAQRPGAPSLNQAEQAEAKSQKDMPPPLNQRGPVDVVKLKRDAEELASLAQSLPPAIDQTSKGLLPKDLSEKLKRIEKLAKQLRSQISQ
jgi:hypothetical protein